RVIPLTGRSSRNAITQLLQIWPTIRKNPIRQVTPSSAQPSTDEGALRGSVSHDDDGIVERRSSAAIRVPTSITEPAGADLPRRGDAPSPPERRDRTVREPSVAPTSTRTKAQTDANREAAVFGAAELELVDLLAPPVDQRRLPVVLVNEAVVDDDSQAEAPPAEKSSEPANQASADEAEAAPQPNQRIVPFPGQPAGADDEETGAAADEAPGPNSGAAEVRIGDGSPIFVAPGPGGVMIASEDQQALDDFETLLKTLASRSGGSGQEFTVFYLKHAKAQTIGPLVSSILSSSAAATLAARGGNLLGDLASGFGGRGRGNFGQGNNVTQISTSSTSAPPSIISDSRLNALFVQANASDLDSIEQLLKVLDQPESPEDISIVAKPRMIPVRYKSAEQIAAVVKEVYANRILGAGGSRGAGGGGGVH
ncbi:MAG: secretin N-terminal domain-containing protein, partial [Pirellulaceae bacterium]